MRGLISPSELKFMPRKMLSVLKSTEPGRLVTDPKLVWNTPSVTVRLLVSVQIFVPTLATVYKLKVKLYVPLTTFVPLALVTLP